jgi:hypothetical protein
MKLHKYLLIIFSAILFFSCNENKILEEIPLDFYSPENSFTTPKQIETAITELYYQTRYVYYSSWNHDINSKWAFAFQAGTDFGRDARGSGDYSIGNYAANISPLSNIPDESWNQLYRIISKANVILNRVTDVTYPTEDEKNAAIAEARFFRGFSYRMLAYLFGGVPIELNEVTSPKRDYTRATREAVYQLCIDDLKFASENLPDINHVKAQGKVSKEAAFHFLAELYLATHEWDKAINAASQVIDNPSFHLMTARFGSRNNEPGDVWWDLFRMGNQNRSGGNTEAIWVAQIEYNAAGGDDSYGDTYRAERFWGCLYWFIKDPDGVNGFIGPTSQNCGRPAGLMGPTDYWATTIWESDWNNDMRNNAFNMIRDFVYDNPNSAYYGKKVSEFPPANLDRRRDFYPFQSKISTPRNHPDELYDDKSTGLLLSSAGTTYTDQYFARLAETYLIRAEAYLGSGDKVKAAADINMVRTRVNATPVAPANVDIDYILDERLRELAYEEKRRLTLARLGMVYERTKKYNSYDEGQTIQPYNDLFPIPYGEIEKNSEAVLEQNPGYN